MRLTVLLASGLLGVGVVYLGRRFSGRRVLANSAKGSMTLVMGLLVWLLAMAVAVNVLSGGVLKAALGVGGIGAFIALAIYYQRHGGHLPLASIAHAPLMVTYWLAYVDAPRFVSVGDSAELKIGLSQHDMDVAIWSLSPGGPSLAEITRRLQEEKLVLKPPKYGEHAMVGCRGLHAGSRLQVGVSGPGLAVEPKYSSAQLDQLVGKPLSLIVRSSSAGGYMLRIDFIDDGGDRRGGLTVPLQVIGGRNLSVPAAVSLVLIGIGILTALASMVLLLAVSTHWPRWLPRPL